MENEKLSTYPLDNLYSYISSGKRVSLFSDENNGFAEKILDSQFNSKFIDSNGNFISELSKSYNQEGPYVKLEENIHHINGSIYGIEKVIVNNSLLNSYSVSTPITFNIKKDIQEANIKTLNINSANINMIFTSNKDIFLSGSQTIKIYNKTGKKILLGSGSDAIKITPIKSDDSKYFKFDNLQIDPLTNGDSDSFYSIDYDVFKNNQIYSPQDKKYNLWLLYNAAESKPWEFSSEWLNTYKDFIHYLTDPKPVVTRVIVTGEETNSDIKYYNESTEPKINKLEIQPNALAKLGYRFSSAYNLKTIGESSYHTGEINYDDEKYQIIYPDGYKEKILIETESQNNSEPETSEEGDNIEEGEVYPDQGGLLNLIPKGAKIIFRETRDRQIKIIPLTVNNVGQITKAIVECNEFIFNTEEQQPEEVGE